MGGVGGGGGGLADSAMIEAQPARHCSQIESAPGLPLQNSGPKIVG